MLVPVRVAFRDVGWRAPNGVVETALDCGAQTVPKPLEAPRGVVLKRCVRGLLFSEEMF